MEAAYPLLPAGSPFLPDTIDSPRVVFDDRRTSLIYRTRDEQAWVRACFERWDATRMCRGEYSPYPVVEPGPWTGIYVVENSRWLRERFEYEARHYGSAYGFGKDVHEMLDEFEHYLFRFHDELVEVVAGGVWFERAPTPVFPDELPPDHPFQGLPAAATAERMVESGLTCQLRRDPRPIEEVLAASALCEQMLAAVAFEPEPEDEDEATVNQWLGVRTRRGRTVSRWRSSFGRVVATFEDIPDDAAWLPLVRAYAAEVAERRSAMKPR